MSSVAHPTFLEMNKKCMKVDRKCTYISQLGACCNTVIKLGSYEKKITILERKKRENVKTLLFTMVNHDSYTLYFLKFYMYFILK